MHYTIVAKLYSQDWPLYPVGVWPRWLYVAPDSHPFLPERSHIVERDTSQRSCTERNVSDQEEFFSLLFMANRFPILSGIRKL